jgi:hypothetical protein
VSGSESHWGGERLRIGLFTLVGAVALMAGLIALFFWAPWEQPSELEWLQSYESWSEGAEAAIASGAAVSTASCESSFDEDVGDPPAERLERAAAAARAGCAEPSPEGWQRAQSDVVLSLRDSHAEEATPRQREDFSELARPLAGAQTRVYCWSREGWGEFAGQYATVRGDDEISLKGLADTAGSRIDLEPGVCTALRNYVRRYRPTALSFENYQLAEGIVVLAHHSRHLASPSTPETEAECYAVQQVRPFIRAAGYDSDYQTELALQAWELGYTQLPPQARSPDCRNGGPLDENPGSDAWP